MPRTYKPVTSGDEMLAELIVLIAKAHKIEGYDYDPQTGELTTPESEKEKAAAKKAEKDIKAADVGTRAKAERGSTDRPKATRGEKTEKVADVKAESKGK